MSNSLYKSSSHSFDDFYFIYRFVVLARDEKKIGIYENVLNYNVLYRRLCLKDKNYDHHVVKRTFNEIHLLLKVPFNINSPSVNLDH